MNLIFYKLFHFEDDFELKEKLFYSIEENLSYLQETWKLSRVPWMYMWTNRFPVEAFENYKDLIQDPRKIKSETMWESYDLFSKFISSKWISKTRMLLRSLWVLFFKSILSWFFKNISK